MTTPLTVYYPYKESPTTYYVARLEVPIYKEVNSQTGTTYTFLSTDNGKLVTASNTASQTYIVPLGLLITGNRIQLLNINTGLVTIQGATGVTLTGLVSLGLGERVELEKTATDTWVSKRLATLQYDNPDILEPNLSGPILSPSNTSFSRLMRTSADITTFDPDAILFTNEYLENEVFGRLSIEFNGRLRFAEVLSSNTTLITAYGITNFPTLVVRNLSGPPTYVLYEGELRHKYLFPFMKQLATDLARPIPTGITDPSPSTNRYSTCSGLLRRGVVREIRKYTFNFVTADFDGYVQVTNLVIDSGTSKIISGARITSIPAGVAPPYYLKVFCPKDKTSTVKSNIGSNLTTETLVRESKPGEPGQLIYKFTTTNITAVVSYLNSSPDIEGWGIQGPDKIINLTTDQAFTLTLERQKILLTQEDLDAIEDPIQRQQAYYERDPITNKAISERYDATGTSDLTIFGSWDRALDEARQSILKDVEIINNGESLIYMDYVIGTYRRYHANGYLWRTESYINTTSANKSILHGPYLEYHPNGRLKIKGAFNDDLLHGPYREFYESGLAKCQGTLRNGKLNGEYVQWDELGNRLFKSYYINGSLANSYALDYEVLTALPC